MGRKVSEIGVEDLMRAGLDFGEATSLEAELKGALCATRGSGSEARELWRELMARRALRPSHPHAVHQLVYYAVYDSYDESTHGPPLYWFPSLQPLYALSTTIRRLRTTYLRSLSSPWDNAMTLFTLGLSAYLVYSTK